MSDTNIEKEPNEKKIEKKSTKKNEKLLNEIEDLKTELQQAKNEYLKAYADADNYKKRLLAEQTTALKYSVQNIANDLLPSVDNLERALANANEEDPLVKGVKMVYDQLINALSKEGVVEIQALNMSFDHNIHHGIMSEKVEGVEPNIVVEVLQKGYMIKDRVLRAALVKVSE